MIIQQPRKRGLSHIIAFISFVAGFTFGVSIWNILDELYSNNSGADISVKINANVMEVQDVAALIATKIRILCLVSTTKRNHDTKAKYIKHTWGKKCSKLVFLSDADDPNVNALLMLPRPGYGFIYHKVRMGLQWAYENHIDDFDWFLKTDDDTFSVMENLRALMAQYSMKEEVYIGREYFLYVDNQTTYYQGGAGYAMNRKALTKLVEEGFPSKRCPREQGMYEDVEISKCMKSIGISTVDTRDDSGLQRFFPEPPEEELQLVPSGDFRYKATDVFPSYPGPECCSKIAVTFHHLLPEVILKLDYLVDRLHVFGRNIYNDSGTVASRFMLAYDIMAKILYSNGYLE